MPSSPERAPVKATYAGRAKRKRLSISYANDNENGGSQSEGESDAGSDFKEERDEEEQPNGTQLRNTASPSLMRPPDNKGPKQVDVHLPGPGPSPKRQRLSPEQESSPSKRAKKASVKPISRVASSIKPLSLGGSKIISPSRFKTPDSNPGDSESIAESNNEVIQRRVRRTEAERIQLFKDDPNCGEAEPHRAYCKPCEKWLSLGKKTTYEFQPWDMHRRRCGGVKVPKSPSQNTKAEQEDAQSDLEDDTKSLVSEAVMESERDAKLTEEERKALLEADLRADSVNPHEVVCKKCQKVIKLAPKRSYILTNWRRHQDKCSGQQQSSRVAMAERKLRIVNDAQALSFTPRTVECANCSQDVALDGDYELTKWEEHKTRCSSGATSRNIVSTNMRSKAGKSKVRPPHSSGSASTDATLVPSAGDASPSRGEKRARDNESKVVASVQGEEGEPARNRPRMDSYVPVDETADAPKPGLWGWFVRPFLSFATGFREAMA